MVRLAAWQLLERPEHAVPQVVHDSQREKAERIARTQRDGIIPATLPAEEQRDLMVLLSVSKTPLMPTITSEADRDRRRATILATAKAIIRA
ncbi:hypothetical protein ACIP98_40325 [Streptomyces sp. NPDC088354]|uniref:hypothetical protein n=1 Tax=Streptomyces sp. NPDC088354 TaxID=3365856 RepID=UPI00382DB01B